MKISSRMKRLLRWSFFLLYLAGSLYWFSRNWLRIAGEFGEPQPHRLEKITGPLHLLAAFYFIFVLGIFWALHVAPSRNAQKLRVSGWGFITVVAFLTLSGLAFIYLGDRSSFLEQAHPIAGLSLGAILSYHWLRVKPTVKAPPRSRTKLP